MCGIVGYIGALQAAPLLLEGLRRLEYRGYDSAGVAVQNGHGVAIRKLAGRVKALDESGATLEERVARALAEVVGTYGLAVLSADEPGKIVVARHGSPVLLGIGDEEFFVASDASAVLAHTRSVVYLDDGDI